MMLTEILACPSCHSDLRSANAILTCPKCNAVYTRDDDRPDLRPHGPIPASFSVVVGNMEEPPAGTFVEALQPSSYSAIRNWHNVKLEPTYGNRLIPEQLSYMPHSGRDEWMLDLGCGEYPLNKPLFENLTGLSYVGVDYSGSAADVLVDAHALPFRDQSFSLITCVAVLEHIARPGIAMSEAYRVLKPGGVMIGTVAFLEPFHLNSYHHMSHLGLYQTLRDAGFSSAIIAPNRTWSGLRAQAEMSLYPIRLPNWLRRLPVVPAELMHKLLWRLKYVFRSAKHLNELNRLHETTAGYRFVAFRSVHEKG
ncbi:SAM-dependent methyltransferase [Inquilinus ginsengisoli]|uniref:methyltransferase domain-containing protein n=1 Tax=Inquilinus ginsengisoli TaxID=363840 RepID=UPI003D1DE6E4